MNAHDNRRCDHRRRSAAAMVAVWLAVTGMPALWAETSPTPAESTVPPSPWRTCVLITGEQFHGEVLSANAEVIDFRWHDRQRIRIPVAMVSYIANPPGVADVVHRTLADHGPTEAEFDPVTRGFAQCHVMSRTTFVAWQLQFGDGGVSIGVSPEGQLTVTLPAGWTADFRQSLRPQREPFTLALRFDDTTWDLRAGDALWQQGRKPAGALHRTTVSACEPGSLIVRRFFSDRAHWPMPTPHEQDAVVRIEGDVWYGSFERLTSTGIEWRGPRGDAALIPWVEFAAVQFRTRASPPGARVTGRVMQYVGPSAWEPWRLERERWLAAETDAGLEHPLLGSLTIQSGDYATRTQWPCRGWQWLHPPPIHLGDQVEPTFRQPLPQGTHVGGEIVLMERPVSSSAMSLDAVGLEPAGSATPATQPFLSALQTGRLRTELVINGTAIGDWNSLLSHRPQPDQPARLRLEIPTTVWRPGRNDWQIRQQPAEDEFDDCELSRIALELR